MAASYASPQSWRSGVSHHSAGYHDARRYDSDPAGGSGHLGRHVRLSVGIEDQTDLIEDFARACTAANAAPSDSAAVTAVSSAFSSFFK